MTKYIESNTIGAGAITTDILPPANLVAPGTQAYDADIGLPVYSNGVSWIPISGGVVGTIDNTLSIISGVLSASPLNVLPGLFTYATLPSATLNARKYAVTTDVGAVFSNGGFWQILYNPTSGSLAISNNTPLTPATQSVPYTQALTATGGVPPYTWSLVSKFAATNNWVITPGATNLTGTPATITTDSLMFQVSDTTGAIAQKLVSLATVASLTPAATPTFSPLGGTYVGTQTVTISCSTSTPTIYYTTNGVTPTTGSTVYTAPISVNASQTVQAIATAPGFTQSAVGSAVYVINAAQMGTNLIDVNYFNPEQPFLNLMKQANGNDNYYQTTWGTCTAIGGGGTHEQGYLQLDADGYVKSLTASPVPPGGQVFTMVQALLNFNINNTAAGLPPDAPFTYGYANIVYRVQFTGKGTIQLATNFTSGSIVQVSGGTFSTTSNSFTSTNNGVNVFTFVVTTPTNGISMAITSLPDIANYIRALSVVDNTLAASFDGGEIFHPRFLASLTNISPIRFMTWLSTDNQTPFIKFPNAITAGDTSAKIGFADGKGTFANGNNQVTAVSGWNTQSAAGDAQEIIAAGFVTPGTTVTGISGSSPNIILTLSAPAISSSGVNQQFSYTFTWTGKTGVYNVLVGSTNSATVNSAVSQMVSMTLTFGSKTATFSAIGHSYPLTPNQNQGTVGYCPMFADWASRPQLTNCFWNSSNTNQVSGPGVPYEVCIALCNKLNVDGWFNIPIWANTLSGVSAFWTSLATLLNSTLNANLKCYIEFSNEVWNGLYPQETYSILAGINTFYPAQNTFSSGQEWYGTQVAGIAAAFRAVFGTTPMTNRVIIGMGEQFALGNGDAFLRAAMNAPEWVALGNTAPYITIGTSLGIFVAPYFGLSSISTADCNTALAQSVPLNVLFQLAYTNAPAAGGGTYSSVPASGFIGNTLATATSLKAANAGQPWGATPHYGYEGGSNFFTAGKPAGWQTLVITAHRDTRFQYLYYDSHAVLSANPGYLPAIAGVGYKFICQFCNCTAINTIGEYGMLENINEPTSPLASAPPKWQGGQKYILGL